jgi:integrase/recombinase XerD
VRLSEAAEFKVTDIDSRPMLIHVRGKGDKDRYTLLGEKAVEVLRTYWKAYRPSDYLFSSRKPDKPLSVSTIQKIFEASHRGSASLRPSTP